MRDLGDLAPGFFVIAGSVGPSHGFVHVREIGGPVEVFGLEVRPGDLIHADRHGAVVIPPAVVPHLANGIDRLLASERIVLEAAQSTDFDYERFRSVWTAFERSRV